MEEKVKDRWKENEENKTFGHKVETENSTCELIQKTKKYTVEQNMKY